MENQITGRRCKAKLAGQPYSLMDGTQCPGTIGIVRGPNGYVYACGNCGVSLGFVNGGKP